MTNRRQFILFSAITLATACSQNKPRHTRLPANSLVIALGDSLTYGFGTQPNTAYPAILAQKTGWQIINSGINGNTSADVLARLDDIIQKRPKLVLLSIGGNDVLQRIDRQITQDNITKIIQTLQQQNIDVVLIAQPHLSASALFGKASDNPIYQSIAEQQNIPLLANTWSNILSDKQLKSDQIHANTQGYAKFAEELYQFLQKLGYC